MVFKPPNQDHEVYHTFMHHSAFSSGWGELAHLPSAPFNTVDAVNAAFSLPWLRHSDWLTGRQTNQRWILYHILYFILGSVIMSGTEHDKCLCKHWKQIWHNYYFTCGGNRDNLIVNVENILVFYRYLSGLGTPSLKPGQSWTKLQRCWQADFVTLGQSQASCFPLFPVFMLG